MKETMTISLRGLRFFSRHGWHDEERLTGNTFDVAVHLETSGSTGTDSLEGTTDYVRAYEIIAAEMAAPRKLLETLARSIADRLHEEFNSVRLITVSIQKLTAAIPNFTGSVGVTYTKEIG
jgi:dihydroneopterin aldolase